MNASAFNVDVGSEKLMLFSLTLVFYSLLLKCRYDQKIFFFFPSDFESVFA